MVMYREFLPHTALQDSVKRFWTLERDYSPANPTDEIVPDACVELIFNFGSAYVLDMGGLRRQLPPVYVVGLQDRPMILRSSGVVRLVAARFYAWGLLPYLDIDAAPGSASAVVLDDDWRALADRLRVEVLADRYDRAVERLEDFLLARRLTMLYEPRQVPSAASLLYRMRGQLKLTEMAAAWGLMRLPFSVLSHDLRFEKIRERLMADPDASLTDLAHEFGFTDQSHLINDFKTFSGRTPGDFAAAMRAFRSVLHDHEHVVFLQSPPSLPDYTPTVG